MRQIKFRALCDYDDTTGMIYFGLPEMDNGLWAFPEDKEIAHINEYLSPLMQYTGLYDLYEDDIIELENWQPNRFIIKFIEGAFCLAHIKTGEHVADIHYIHHAGKVQYKLLGNIYEHLHLLT